MKKILKKFITVLLIVLILFNFSFLEPVSYADTFSETLTNILGTFVGILTWIFRVPAIGLAFSINLLTAGIAYMDGATSPDVSVATITPFDIFANKVRLFDVNFFDLGSELEGTTVYKIRLAVSQWFYVLRLIAISILLLVLIYVGIRMAISSVAEDKAKYKQMLVDWSVSLALVFVLQYIIIFTVNINNALVNVIIGASGGIDGVNDAIGEIALTGLGLSAKALGATVVYCMIVWQTFSFVLAYLNRTIKIAFLIIISPLISITYSIDKMGDGKAQALNNWLKEFVYTILMQPFHCVIYVVLVDLAFGLLVESGGAVAEAVIAILCIKFVKTAEEIVRKIFSFGDDNKNTSLAAGTAVAAAALSKAKDIGKTARKGINFVKESKIGESLKEDSVKVRSAFRALKKTKEDKEVEKNGGEAPSYSARMKREQNKIYEKQEKDKLQKEQVKNQTAWEKYNMHKGSYTKDDKSKIKELQAEYRRQGMEPEEAFKAAATKVSREKIESGAYRSKFVKGVRSVRKAVQTVGNLNTVKFITHTAIPVGFGMATGFMSYGGDANVFQAGMLGTATAKSGIEFMQNSTGTLTHDISEQLMAQGIVDKSEIEQAMQQIKLDGDSGAFDQEELKKILEQVENAINDKSLFAEIQRAIEKQFLDGNPNFDLNSLLKEKLAETGVNKSETEISNITTSLEKYKNFKHNSIIYQSIQNGEQVGISLDTLTKKASNEIDLELSSEKIKEDAKNTVISKETVQTVAHRENLSFEDIKGKLEDSLREVQNQIDELDSIMKTLSDSQKKIAQKNMGKLQDNKTMLTTNIGIIEEMAQGNL